MNEEAIFSRIQLLDRTWKLSYAEAGILCLKVNTEMLWQTRLDPTTGLPCASWTQWVKIAAPYSYATVFQAVRDCEELSDVPESELSQITRGNFGLMKQLSSAVRADPRVLQCAKTMKAEEFTEEIRKEYPTQHLETRKILRFVGVAESAAEQIEQALAMAEARGSQTRNESLEAIAVEALQTWAMEEEIEKMAAEMPEEL